MNMDFCPVCGTKLHLKHLEHEGDIPYCENCKDFRFPIFSTAVSMITLSPDKNRMLFLKQYGNDFYVLPAGYVNKGESAEDAVRREIKEELGAKVKKLYFNRSGYFEKSQTLILNFTAVLESEELNPNYEVDSFGWFSFPDAKKSIKPNSLAEKFVVGFIDNNEVIK